MHAILNIMRREAERTTSQWARKRIGIVDAYDPSHYAVKVRIQPENTLTGWVPVMSPWVGNGWGLFAGPSPGDVVEVDFQEGGKEAGFAGLRFFSTVTKPLPVPSGEYWLVHQSGAYVKLTNDGKLNLQDASGASLVLDNNGTATLTANLLVNGTITATGDISDQNGAKGTVQNIRSVYDTHTHDGVASGSATTAIPNQPL
jgi:uncharacterized protein involved in type VI secretion and phage assembly